MLDVFGLSAASQKRREREKGKHSRNSEYPYGNKKSVKYAVLAKHTNAQGQIIDPETNKVMPKDQVTIEYKISVVNHWNEVCYNQSKAERKAWYNDINNLIVEI